MNLVVDTSIWSLLLRRKHIPPEDPRVGRLRNYLEERHDIHLLGPVLQELLEGIREQSQFRLLVRYFQPFPMIALERSDFIEASRLRNHCRTKGVQAGPVDFLIAAACLRREFPLLTADGDFRHIARHCKLLLA